MAGQENGLLVNGTPSEPTHSHIDNSLHPSPSQPLSSDEDLSHPPATNLARPPPPTIESQSMRDLGPPPIPGLYTIAGSAPEEETGMQGEGGGDGDGEEEGDVPDTPEQGEESIRSVREGRGVGDMTLVSTLKNEEAEDEGSGADGDTEDEDNSEDEEDDDPNTEFLGPTTQSLAPRAQLRQSAIVYGTPASVSASPVGVGGASRGGSVVDGTRDEDSEMVEEEDGEGGQHDLQPRKGVEGEGMDIDGPESAENDGIQAPGSAEQTDTNDPIPAEKDTPTLPIPPLTTSERAAKIAEVRARNALRSSNPPAPLAAIPSVTERGEQEETDSFDDGHAMRVDSRRKEAGRVLVAAAAERGGGGRTGKSGREGWPEGEAQSDKTSSRRNGSVASGRGKRMMDIEDDEDDEDEEDDANMEDEPMREDQLMDVDEEPERSEEVVKGTGEMDIDMAPVDDEEPAQAGSPPMDIDPPAAPGSVVPATPAESPKPSAVVPRRGVPESRKLGRTSVHPSRDDSLEETMPNPPGGGTAQESGTAGTGTSTGSTGTKSTRSRTSQRSEGGGKAVEPVEDAEAGGMDLDQPVEEAVNETFNPRPDMKTPARTYAGRRKKTGVNSPEPEVEPESSEEQPLAMKMAGRGKGKARVVHEESDDEVEGADEVVQDDVPAAKSATRKSISTRAAGDSKKSNARAGPSARELDSATKPTRRLSKRAREEDAAAEEERIQDVGPSVRKRRKASVVVQAESNESETEEEEEEGMAEEPSASVVDGWKNVTRVFAVWSSDKHLYPGIITGSVGGAYEVTFDDHTTAVVKLESLRMSLIKVGDIVDSVVKRINKSVGEMTITAVKGDAKNGMAPDHEVSVKSVKTGEVVEDTIISRLRIKPKRKSQWNDRMLQPDQIRVVVPPVGALRVKTEKHLSPVNQQSNVLAGKGFMITNPNNAKEETTILKRMIVRNGGIVCDDMWGFYAKPGLALLPRAGRLKGIYLVTIGEPIHNVKFLLSLAMGIPCIASQYIFDVLEDDSLDWRDYLLSAGYCSHLEGERSQIISPSWGEDDFTPNFPSPGHHRPLTGKAVYLTSEVNSVFSDVVRAMGGTPTKIANLHVDSNIEGADFVVVDKQRHRAFKDDPKLANVEWLKQSMIMGRLLPKQLLKGKPVKAEVKKEG